MVGDSNKTVEIDGCITDARQQNDFADKSDAKGSSFESCEFWLWLSIDIWKHKTPGGLHDTLKTFVLHGLIKPDTLVAEAMCRRWIKNLVYQQKFNGLILKDFK